MVEGLLGGASSTASVLDRIVEAAEGNPLFAEQLLECSPTRAARAADGVWRATSDLSEIHVPPTIQALLASRLDTARERTNAR